MSYRSGCHHHLHHPYLELVPSVPVGTLGSSLMPERTIHRRSVANTRISPYWILLELWTMEALVTTGTTSRVKLQSNRHHQQTNTQLFLQAYALLSPNCQSSEDLQLQTKNHKYRYLQHIMHCTSQVYHYH